MKREVGATEARSAWPQREESDESLASVKDDGGGGDAVPSGGDAGGGGGQSFGGRVNNTDDVIRALDQILAYYARSEPSSPLPLLIERAKRLVRADFMTIMRDMAPAGVENVSVISGDGDE